MQRWNSGSQGSGVRLCSLPPLVSISSSKKYPTKLMFQLETIWSLPSNVVHISNTVCIFYSNIQNKRSFRCWPERIPSAASCEATSLDLESPASASALCQVHSGTAARLMQWVGEKGEKKKQQSLQCHAHPLDNRHQRGKELQSPRCAARAPQFRLLSLPRTAVALSAPAAALFNI